MHIFIFIDQYNDYSDGKMCKYRMIDLLLLNTEWAGRGYFVMK
jgi:hypothetical protein